MNQLLLSLLAFLLLHSVPAMPAVRAGAIALVGRPLYLGLYSLVSLLVIAWVFHAALTSDYVSLWDAAGWQAVVTLITAPAGLFLVVAGLLGANPVSISFRGGSELGAITTVTRHPVLWGFILWSFGHLAPNGDLRSLILFGGLGLFSVAGLFVLDRRARRKLGAAWSGIAAATSVLPFAAMMSGRTRLRIDMPTLAALLLVVGATWWLLARGHALLFGADPLLAATF